MSGSIIIPKDKIRRHLNTAISELEAARLIIPVPACKHDTNQIIAGIEKLRATIEMLG